MTERIEIFRELRVYQTAFELQQEVCRVSKTFPKEEMFSLTDQIRRSSRAIGANLAEACPEMLNIDDRWQTTDDSTY
jgi:four helix bundle protein